MIFKNQADMPPQCPPEDATPKDIEPVYRIIENEEVQEIDFLNHIERKLFYRSARKCEAIALSFFSNEKAVLELKRRIKNFKNKLISKGKITSECGEHTIENSHINLWVYKDVEMLKVFLGEEDKDENK
jgi:ribosomal protein S18